MQQIGMILADDGLSDNEKIKYLREYQEELNTVIDSEISLLKKDKKYCKYCHQYSDAMFWKVVTELVQREHRYTSAGEWDDDVVVPYQATIIYKQCPICQQKIKEAEL